MFSVILSLSLIVAATAAGPVPPGYILGPQGVSCEAACLDTFRTCVPHVVTDDSTKIFEELGIDCSKKPSAQGGKWWAADQPSYSSDPQDVNYGECLGYIGTPNISSCGAAESSVRRVCQCGALLEPSSALTFGTGLSGGSVPAAETTLFAHQIAPGHVGVMNHFWSTCSPAAETNLLVRYYIDGEANASIAMHPAMAAGTGFDDPSAPWGTKWIGLGAGKGGGQAWFHNIKIPFQKSIRITIQADKSYGGFYIIVRGGLDLPLVVGDVTLPPTARMQLQKFEGRVDPLQVLDIVNVPKGFSGQHFMSALAVNNSGVGLNFLEGCYHMYDPADQAFPGTVLSTGTEDYFDSGWYFNAGEFHLPVSGMTHLVNQPKNVTEWSAYRFHEMDPLRFGNGFRLTWRCGDMTGSAPDGGGKCYTQTGGPPVGNPVCEHVISYAWVYVWPN
eukprot:m.249343 g.249343  ORF g.249343 m.249343 type:complete len:445 (-) comp19517_c0_seq1:240-1574(-)